MTDQTQEEMREEREWQEFQQWADRTFGGEFKHEDFTTYNRMYAAWQAATAQSAEKIARLESERQWRPIETAPKDGTIVDLLIDGERITDCYWGLPNHSCGEQGRYCDSDWHNLSDYWVCSIFNEQLGEGATHWMPLPPSPEQKG